MTQALKKYKPGNYNHPTKFTSAPYGTLWEVLVDNDISIFYVQTNDNSLEPKWERLGLVLEKACKDLIFEEDFIFKCLELFKNYTNDLSLFRKIISREL